MTACLYFSPWQVPALLADTLVTSRDVSTPFPSPGNKISQIKGYNRTNVVKLVRKIEIFDKRLALAAAGNEAAITSYFRSVREIALSNPGRPTGPLSEKAGEYAPDQLGVIGAYVPGSVFDPKFNIRPTRLKPIESPKLGRYFAIGSGAQEMRQFAHRYNDSIMARSSKSYMEAPYEIIREVAENVCAHTLNSESFSSELNTKTWGGFFEYAYFYEHEHQWVYGPRRANFYFDCFILPSNRIVCLISNRAVFYKPNVNSSYVCTVTRSSDGAELTEWILESVNKPGDFEKDFDDRWRGWKPESANFTFNLYTETGIKHASFCNEIYDREKFSASVSESGFEWKFDPSYIDKILAKVCRGWGRHPISAQELSASEKAFIAKKTELID